MSLPGPIAFVLPNLFGGGERIALTLAEGFARRGLPVEIVLAKAEGPLLASVPPGMRVIDLKAPRVLLSMPALVAYLRRTRPAFAMSFDEVTNLFLLAARRLARSQVKVVLGVHNVVALLAKVIPWKAKVILPLARRLYAEADHLVAVSLGVAADLSATLGLSRDRVSVIPNPVVGPHLWARSGLPLEDPWFAPGAPGVVLGVGRLTHQKDFPTLLRAFDRLRRDRPSRLMILGEGPDRQALERLAQDLQLGDAFRLPGFTANPFPYLARSSVFALSSAWEGLPTVLIEALALGTKVVATDCQHGPREILEGGRWGQLVPPGDPAALAVALQAAWDAPPPERPASTWARYDVDTAVARYLSLMGVQADSD